MVSYKKLKNFLQYSTFAEIAMNSNNLFASDKKKSGGCCNSAKVDDNEKKKQEETNQTEVQTPKEDNSKILEECRALLVEIQKFDKDYIVDFSKYTSKDQLTNLKNQLNARLAELKNKPKENPEEKDPEKDKNPKDKDPKDKDPEKDKNPKDKDPKDKDPEKDKNPEDSKDKENSKFDIKTFLGKLNDFGKKKSILLKIKNDEEFKKEVNKLKDEYLYFVNIFSDLDSLYEKNPDLGSSMRKQDLLVYFDDYLWYSDIEKIRKDKLEEPAKIAKLKAECKDLLEKIREIAYDYKDNFEFKDWQGYWIYDTELKSYEAYKNRLKSDLDEKINNNEELKKQIDDIKSQKKVIYEVIHKDAIAYFRLKLKDLSELYGKFCNKFTYNVTYGDKIEERVVNVLDTKDITDEEGFNDNFDTFIGNVDKYYKDQVDSINEGGLLTGKFHKFEGYEKIQDFIEKDLKTKGASYTVEKYRRFFDAFDNVSKILKRLRGSSNSTSLYDLGVEFFDKFGTGFESKFYQDGHLSKEYNKIAELDKEMKKILSGK